MTDACRVLLRALTILFAAVAMPQAAHACTDGAGMRYYFLRQPPEITPDIMFVQVTIVSKTGTSVEARLEGPFAKLSNDGMIHIVLPVEPQGTNCIDWGDLEGPVYVVVSSALIRDGHASVMARPVALPDRGYHRRPGERQLLNEFRREGQVWIDPDYGRPNQP